MLRAILFDFDGTIALSEPMHFAAFDEVLAPRGVVLIELAYYERYVSLTDRECLERMIEDYARPDLRAELPALLTAKAEAMAERLARGVPLCPGVRDFVAMAAARAPLAIVSGALRHEIVGVLERAGLERFFPLIVSAEDVASGKPDPQGYRFAMERLRAASLADLEGSQCLVIEDTPKGIAAARAAGMRVVALPHTIRADALAGADRVYPSYDQISWSELETLFA
jgi:HAD superfamily hydrolase (TIGR01509 family)